MFNITAGASVTNSILQAIDSGMHGFYYGALLVTTGSILPSILIHIVYDFVCFSGDPTLTNGVMTGELTTFAIVEAMVIAIITVAITVFLMKKIGDQKILSVWEKKWSLNRVPSEDN